MKKLAFLSICLIVRFFYFHCRLFFFSDDHDYTCSYFVRYHRSIRGYRPHYYQRGQNRNLYHGGIASFILGHRLGGKNTMHGNEGPYQYKGVAMSQLLKAVGGMTDQNSLVVTGSGAYTKTLTYDQVVNGNFPVMDNSGNQVTPVKTPVLFVVYEQSGAALDSTSGPLMLGIMTDQSQLTGGNLWIKGLSAIQVISAQ